MLIPCPICQRQVSEQAAFCPGCGHPIAAAGSDEPRSPAPEPADAAPEAADPEVLAAAEVTPETEPTAGTGPAAEDPPRMQGLSPDPNPTPPHAYSDRAFDVPGSFPAAMLLLTVFALGLIARAMPAGSGRSSPGAVSCVTFVTAVGLLHGGSGFRTWGAFSSLFGLLIWPPLLAAGTFGAAGPGRYLGLIFNIGILLLLVGVPSRKRVRWGIGVAVLGLLASGIG